MNIALNHFNAIPLAAWTRMLGAMRTQHPQVARRIAPATQGPTTIDKGATLVVERPQGTQVFCVSGSVWITHDGATKDVILDAGDTYRSDRSSRMLVHGLAASTAMVL